MSNSHLDLLIPFLTVTEIYIIMIFPPGVWRHQQIVLRIMLVSPFLLRIFRAFRLIMYTFLFACAFTAITQSVQIYFVVVASAMWGSFALYVSSMMNGVIMYESVPSRLENNFMELEMGETKDLQVVFVQLFLPSFTEAGSVLFTTIYCPRLCAYSIDDAAKPR